VQAHIDSHAKGDSFLSVLRASTLLSTTVAASLLCVSLALPAIAEAAAPEPEAGDEDPALTEAKALYKDGETKFQIADYEEALNSWKRAYGMLSDGEDTRAIRHALVYNIARAHSKAYEVTRNPTHLRKAKLLLENYRAEHRALYGDAPEALKDRGEADDRIAELEVKIAASEAAGETSSPLSEPRPEPTDDGQSGTPAEPSPPVQTEVPLTPDQQWQADINIDPILGPKWERSGKHVVGGAVLVGIGGVVGLISLGIFSIASAISSARGGDPAVGTLVTGSIFAAGAVGMVVPGAIKIARGRKARAEVLEAKPRPTGVLVPMFLPKGGGVGWAMRF